MQQRADAGLARGSGQPDLQRLDGKPWPCASAATASTQQKRVRGFRADPYAAHLLAKLPRRNEWVFSVPAAKSGRPAEPSSAHRRACAVAGLDGLTLHGLRQPVRVELLLVGGDKRRQRADIAAALKYWQDWQRRNEP